MTNLKVFADLMSQPSRAVVIFCRAANIPHEFRQLRIAKSEQRTPEFSKINPFFTLPAIEHNGRPIFESVAILKYLARTFQVDDHWYPSDPLAQAKLEEYLSWQHLNTRMNCRMFYRSAWLVPTMEKRLPDPKEVAKYKKLMLNTLHQIESIWLKNGSKRFISGDEISVGDLLACSELEQPLMAGFDVRQGRSILTDYMERVRSNTNPHYDECHKIVYQMRDKFGGKIPGVNL